MSNLSKSFDDAFERQKLILKSHIEGGTRYKKYTATHALKFTEDLQIRCKKIVDSDDPNRWNTLKVFLEYNKDFMETQKDLAEALLNVRDKTAAIKLLEYYQTNKFKGFVVHGVGDDDPTGLIKVAAEDELHFIDDLKAERGSMDDLYSWDLFNKTDFFTKLNLELVGRLIYAVSLYQERRKMSNSQLKHRLAQLKERLVNSIKLYKNECETKIKEAKIEIDRAKQHKKEDPSDFHLTNVMSEPGDGDAVTTNANLNIQLAEETIVFGEELEHTVDLFGKTEDPRVVHDLYDALKQHLPKLESEYEKIPKPTTVFGLHDANTRENDLIYIKRHWINKKMNIVKSLLKLFPDGAEFGTELQEIVTGGRKRTGRKRSGKKRKRTGRKRSGKKRTVGKKRKSTTRRK